MRCVSGCLNKGMPNWPRYVREYKQLHILLPELADQLNALESLVPLPTFGSLVQDNVSGRDVILDWLREGVAVGVLLPNEGVNAKRHLTYYW